MSNKGNVVLYLDKELAEKTKELGFNFSKTFENYLKQLLNQFFKRQFAESNCGSPERFELSAMQKCGFLETERTEPLDLNPFGYKYRRDPLPFWCESRDIFN